jgi:hypothetical protein
VPTQRDLIKRLLTECLDFEIENECLHRMIAAIRLADPSAPVLEALQLIRQDSGIRDAAIARYNPLFDLIGKDELAEVLSRLPCSKYSN